MSGPQRHGLRRLAAIACFLLLALSFALLREGGASAHAPKHAGGAHHSTSGLLGGLDGVVHGAGHTVHGVLKGVGGLLGAPTKAPHSGHPTSPPPSSTPVSVPPSAPVSGAPRSSRPPTAHPTHRTTARPAQAVAVLRHRPTRSAVPVPVAARPSRSGSSDRAANPPSRPVALQPPDSGVPELDVMQALAAVTIAMVLGVGLIVYRAGYREERAH